MQWRYTGDVMCHFISSGDKALIMNFYPFKKCSFWRILAEFLKINCNRERAEMLLTQIWETCSTDQRHETGRLKHTRTEENVTTVDEMVSLLNYKNRKQRCRSIRQISKETDLAKCKDRTDAFLFESVFCLPTRFVSFSCIHISRGSVSTHLTCGGIFNSYFIANCPRNA